MVLQIIFTVSKTNAPNTIIARAIQNIVDYLFDVSIIMLDSFAVNIDFTFGDEYCHVE